MAAANGKMGVGNLAVGKDGDVITLQILSFHRGAPLALFTVAEIDTLIGVLKSFQAKAKPAENDWEDLI